MAGNCHRELVCGAGAGDCAQGLGGADASCEFSVGDSRTDGNLLERLPDALLESGAPDIERQIEPEFRCFHATDNARDYSLVFPVGTNQAGFWEAVLQIMEQCLRIVAQKDRGNTLRARGDKDGAQKRLADRKLDL